MNANQALNRTRIRIDTCADDGMPAGRRYRTRLECTCLDFEALWSPLWTGNGNFTGNLQIITREALASLELVDYYSRFPEIRHLSSTRSANVISALTEIFACHGIPSEIVSDNGPQFSGAEFQQFAVKLGFRHITSSPRYPQGNGLVERCVQTVKAMLKKARFTGESLAWLCSRTEQLRMRRP